MSSPPLRNSAVVWKDYALALLWMVPPTLAWLFSIVILMPRLERVWEHVGQHSAGISTLIDLSRAFVDYGQFIFVVVMGLALFLEKFASWWPIYRRSILAAFVFIYMTLVFALTLCLATAGLGVIKL